MSSESQGKRIKARRMRRQRAHMRVRHKVQGTPERPRLAVYKSLKYVYAQIIDDLNGVTVAQANSREDDLRSGLEGSTSSIEAAKAVGKLIAERAKRQGVESVVFDRGGFIYHGKIQAVAEGARDKGLQF
ncbi:MAG: 50S ribosomal protein L18 [Acidobacteriota bacterium]